MDSITKSLGLMSGSEIGGKILQELQNEIEGELSTSKAKSRNDLHSSMNNFRKGIESLNLAKSTENEESESLQPEQIKLAQESFIEADKKANTAFHDASLTVEEKITACKICIVSSTLRHYNDSKAAESDSMVYLKNLNSLPEVRKLFPNTKPARDQDQKDKNVNNVIMINLFLAEFISKKTSKKYAVLDWPLIKCGEQMFHPLYFKEVEGISVVSTPWHESYFCMEERHLLVDKEITFTNEGQMVIFSGNILQKVDSETGKLQPWSKENYEIDDWQVRCMTVDNNGVVYVISGYGRKNTWKYLMTVFSKDSIVQQSTLKFLDNKEARKLFMAVTQDEKIVVAFVEGNKSNINVCGCYKNGEIFLEVLKETSKPSPIVGEMKSLSISDNNTIAIIIYKERRFRNYYKLLIYNMEGDLLQVVKFNPSLKEIETYNEVIYTPFSKCITGYYFADSKIVIENFSAETGKHQSSLILMNTGYDSVRLAHHANGKVALVTKERIVYLKKKLDKNPRCKMVVKRNVRSSSNPIYDKKVSDFLTAKKIPDSMLIDRGLNKIGKNTKDSSESKLPRSFSEGCSLGIRPRCYAISTSSMTVVRDKLVEPKNKKSEGRLQNPDTMESK